MRPTINALRAEGINFAVNRMLSAWESGFINDTPEQAYDITGGFLTAQLSEWININYATVVAKPESALHQA